ncbi:exo-alpha-sialidase [Aliifodinibius sp. S!AR15-10]|uniref:sialidase family protein n=1 Tax=Aliifodinibius sp. S!AR15-10 TaxID=2950437 RepID=UPI0028563549|nr:sialidase family protein [Aliifodinibius sp. S!AR15-10]MDR8391950.1 exo-alpha-sialidase [Aliifodinibius sp. S!AR15-10]
MNNTIALDYKVSNWTALVFTVLLLLLAVGCGKESSSENENQAVVEEEFIYEVASFPSAHASTIEETEEGVIAAWFGGTEERNPDVGIWVSRKPNGGEWTEPVEVANGVQDEETRYPTWNPVLYRTPKGKIMLFYKVGPSPSEWWGMLITSDDGGQTWSEPERLPEGILGPIKNKPVLLDNGDLISGSSTEHDGWQVHFEISQDTGETWQKVGPLNEGEEFMVIQPTILNHGDGTLQMLCRSQSRAIVESWSEDYGQSWSPLSKSSLPNNNSGLDAVTLDDGRHLLVYNHVLPPEGAERGKGERAPLNVAVSEDGKTWSAALVLEDSEISQYSYPSVIQSEDGMVHIVYTWRRDRIKYVKVDPDELELRPIENGEWPVQVE